MRDIRCRRGRGARGERRRGGRRQSRGMKKSARQRHHVMRKCSCLQEHVMTQRELLAQQALKLPPEDRVYVADVLEQSLTTGGFTGPEIADAWASEIARRID